MEANQRQDGQLQQPAKLEEVGLVASRASTDPRKLRGLRAAAAAEATTLLLLIGVAVPLKHLDGWSMGVHILGPVHGLAFAAYIWLVVQSFGAGLLSRDGAVRLALCAFIPLAGYVVADRVGDFGSERLMRGRGE